MRPPYPHAHGPCPNIHPMPHPCPQTPAALATQAAPGALVAPAMPHQGCGAPPILPPLPHHQTLFAPDHSSTDLHAAAVPWHPVYMLPLCVWWLVVMVHMVVGGDGTHGGDLWQHIHTHTHTTITTQKHTSSNSILKCCPPLIPSTCIQHPIMAIDKRIDLPPAYQCLQFPLHPWHICVECRCCMCQVE